MRKLLLAASLCGLALGAQAASLQGRDLTGDNIADAYYDSSLNISWLADWSAAAGSSYDNGVNHGDGRLSWDRAMAWAGDFSLGGYSNWRLPKNVAVDGQSFDMGFSSDGSTDHGMH